MIEEIIIKSNRRNELINITSKVSDFIKNSNIKEGLATIYIPHTTAGIIINEHADPSVAEDIENVLMKMVPENNGYLHFEGNSDSHIKSAITGSSVSVIISEYQLLLGTWQGIFFCEFDGPRTRKVYIKIIKG